MRTPTSQAARQFASPRPRVLCMWAAPVRSPISARTRVKQPSHLRRVGHAGGVRQADFVRARLGDLRGQPDDVVLRHLALQRAAERGRRSRPRRRPWVRAALRSATMARTSSTICSRVLRTLASECAALADTGIVILCTPASMAASAPLQVRHQRHHRPSGQRDRVPHDVGGVGHLRQQLRRHERSDLDLAQAGRVQRVDPARTWPQSASCARRSAGRRAGRLR